MIARPLSGWPWLTSRRLMVVAVSAAAALITLKGVAGYVHTDRDSRSMARAIARFVDPRRYDEIVFVGMRPFYGLNVYLDIKIEGVQIAERRFDYSKFVAEDDLCDELDERERSVFALKESKAEKFRLGVERCEGLDPAVIGHFDADGNRIVLFVVRS